MTWIDMTICTAHVFHHPYPYQLRLSDPYIICDLPHTPLRALHYSTLRYIEYPHDYIHYVCISGANCFTGEYIHDCRMRHARCASDSPRTYV